MAVQVGAAAPEFTLPNQDGQMVRLSDFRGRKVVLFAFPKAGTPGCTTQACAFRDEFPAFTSTNAVVLGISADTPADLKAWKQNKKLPYDLLSDERHTTLEQYGAWGMGVGLIRLPVVNRSYWVIDEQGVIIAMQTGIGPKQSVTEAITALQSARV